MLKREVLKTLTTGAAFVAVLMLGISIAGVAIYTYPFMRLS